MPEGCGLREGGADGEWVARLRAVHEGGGSVAAEAALAELLGRLGEVLVRFGERQLRRLPDPHDAAQDVAQETLLRVARGAAACDADCDARFLAWVFTIARHVVTDELRSSARRVGVPRRAEDLQRLGDVCTFDAWTQGSGDGLDHEAATRAAGSLAAVTRAAYDALPPATADLLWLRAVGGATWPAVAAALGTTAAGAKRRFQRATKRMQRAVLNGIAALPARERAAALAALGADPVAGPHRHPASRA